MRFAGVIERQSRSFRYLSISCVNVRRTSRAHWHFHSFPAPRPKVALSE